MPGLKTNEVKLISQNGLQQKSITIDNSGNPFFNGIQIPTVSSPTISSPTFTGIANFASGGLNVGSGQLVIDSSGRVLTSYQPAFCARGVSNTVSATSRTYLFDQTIDFNIGSHYNSSNGTFTAPINGVYFFEFHIFATAGYRYLANLVKNGTTIQEYTQEQPTGGGTSQGYGSLDGKILMKLNTNDYVTVTGSASVIGNAILYSSFSGYLLG